MEPPMPIDRVRARQCLKAFDFRKLFLEELGWDKFSEPLVKAIDGHEYPFYAVAEKRGVVVLVCDSIPEYAVRVKLDKLVAKDHFEHLIVFADKAHGRQVWQWVRKEPGKPTAVRTYHYSAISASGGAGELLLQKLDNLAFTLEEEESVRTGTVTGRLKTFDVEKVTKKFYERFKTEHSGFLGFIKGIPDKQMESWYASVMINRLMFLYFIQEKGFLNADKNYLRVKLAESGARKTNGYYTDFLSPLFFQGFARKKADRSAATNKLLGDIPYLNGGLFQKHQIEELHGKTIVIPDKAFEKLFDFFKEYNWHLDEREDRNDREINPDVLGYIFEKYINQKQMGAYYTKEDITEYISQNTIIPFLLDEARKGCAIAFAPEGAVWHLLRDDPDRYIHDAMKKGADLALPPEIEGGVHDVAQRASWNRTAPEEYALPTEIWREAIDRHQRYRAVKAKLASGEVHEVNDLVTLNLNIRQFAQDVIQFSEGPELLRVIWKAIEKVSVLDPTCGSGAFLFAALNILKPLYEACLIRMQGFIEDNDAVRPKTAEETILAFIGSGESANLEFKSTARWNVKESKADKTMEQVIVKTVAALLNSHGGDLLIGVADNGTILGIEADQQLWKPDQRNRDTYENWLTTLLLEAFGKHHTANLHISLARLEENDVCRVSILPSETAVYVKDGNAEILYVRTGNSTRALTTKEAVAYHQQRFTSLHQPHVEPQKSPTSKKYSDFRKVVEDSKRHPRQDYFILKSIIVNNLFGVDIMEEAVEICKLRLFLKLVAQVDSQDRIEPLPDIDFNIRAGNTLVGYARYEDVERAVGSKLDFGDAMSRIQDKALTLDSAVEMFRKQQTQLDGTITLDDKLDLRRRFSELEAELNDYLSGEYGVNKTGIKKWRESYKPFHWFCDFHSIMQRGGFDVLIGNPPYVEYSKIRHQYTLQSEYDDYLSNLYAATSYRAKQLVSNESRTSLIVPASLPSTDRMEVLRSQLSRNASLIHVSFSTRPQKLFEGAEQRLTIYIYSPSQAPRIYAGGYLKWYSDARDTLFDTICFTETPARGYRNHIWPKIESPITLTILQKIMDADRQIGLVALGHDEKLFYKNTGLRYFNTVSLVAPKCRINGKAAPSSRETTISLRTEWLPCIHTVLMSTTYFIFYQAMTNCRDLNPSDILTFPIPTGIEASKRLRELSATIEKDCQAKSRILTMNNKLTGKVELQSLSPAKSKSIIDEIDTVLAGYYGFSNKDLDYIVNYDIKFRLSADASEE
jgi:hypothetical protein